MEGVNENSNISSMQINNFNNLPTNLNNNTEPNPKRQAVFDRLKKRMNLYRKRQNESIPRFDHTFNGICEQQSVETNVLQKRFVESKAKRVAKKTDKKQIDVNLSHTKMQNNKRSADLDNEDTPPIKMPSTSSNTMDNMKFQVEIVHEFTTSAASLQPQQISTNVTVKATTNGSSLKYEPQDVKPMKIEPMPPAPPDIQQDFKQEPDNEFADLDFGGLANFMANDENELKKLFSNINEVFDQDLFDQDRIKQEPRSSQNIPLLSHPNMNQLSQANQQYHYVMPECQMQKPMFQPQAEMSPAAQTLKNMAQQHQVKNSMAMNYMRSNVNQQSVMQPQNNQQRMPYQPQQFNDFPIQFQKSQMPFSPDMIKQEINMMQQQPIHHQMKPIMSHQLAQEDVKNVIPHYQQNYQNAQFNHHNHQRNTFNSNPNPSMINIAMKQQFNGTMTGGSIHIQGGQQITGRMGDFSMQQQQQMYFNQYSNQRPNHHTNNDAGPTFNMMQNQTMSFTQQ